MSELLHPGYVPFVVAIGAMVAIGTLEALALLAGLTLTGHADHFLTAHLPGPHAAAAGALDAGEGGGAGIVGACLGWLHVGRVPLLMLLILFLTGFSIAGLLLQWLLATATAHLLPGAVAAALATLAALPFVRGAGGLLVRYFPQDESSAVSESDFVGRVARITLGQASAEHPAGARLIDDHGRAHYIRVAPEDATQTLSRGQEVLVVARASGSLYRAIPNPRPDLL
ncbi:OB-fold-containig protein [Cupriavidus malaysiensis]|uniref:DUF1449 family protein n=1 Tax=Cupriavidus malaysiensis TaxID=367825 RepID=A0ABN4TUN5_9BURK|nr:OB-fold-containig protein [Cupriavidus malaysiensis]AOZ10001.1 hypothetical protein BKK80_30520 [Cupriavidus malaysiensis]